ncbi:MAG: response regulator transcription factor [Acidobacteria bacterium]|nr:response regulator transcription factor [Acidobacteriota bacterium]
MTKRLLVADDSPTIHKVVRLAFADADVQVESVERDEEILDRAAQFRADLILLDASMPGLSVNQICDRLKSVPELAQVPVLLMVGPDNAWDEFETGRVGCDGCLRKPFDMDELTGLARRLLRLEEEGAPAAALVSERTRESFLGSNSILDVFGPDLPKVEAAAAGLASVPPAPTMEAPRIPTPAAAAPAAPPPHVIPFPIPKANEAQEAPVELPDEILEAIAQRVIRQMSPDVIREVAWEVVPDLAEIIIRQYLEERGIGR